MKVSKTTWIIIIAILAITSFASLGTLCWQRFGEMKHLREEFAFVEDKLQEYQSGQLSYRGQALDLQLEQILGEVQTSESLFSRPSWDIATSSLFDIAEACNVEVTSISSAGLNSEGLGEITSTAQRFNVTIEGALNDLIKYITRLNHDLKTSVVKSVDLSVPVDAQEIPSAKFLLIVYSYGGG